MVVVIWSYSGNVCSSCKEGRVGTDQTRHREGRMCTCVRQRILDTHRDRDTKRDRDREKERGGESHTEKSKGKK